MGKLGVFKLYYKRQKGQELVEFALAVPLLLLVLFGALDLGRAFHASITIANAARVGARFGVNYNWSEGNGYPGIIIAARSEAQGSGFNPLDLQVLPDCGACASGDSLTVTVSYPFQFIIGGVMGWSNLTLQRSAVMMIP